MAAHYEGYVVDKTTGTLHEGRLKNYRWYMMGPVQFAATAALMLLGTFGIGQLGRMSTIMDFKPAVTETHTGCTASAPVIENDERVSTITCSDGFQQKVSAVPFFARGTNIDMLFGGTGVCNEFAPLLTGETNPPYCGIPSE